MPGKMGNDGTCKYVTQTEEEHATRLTWPMKKRKRKIKFSHDHFC